MPMMKRRKERLVVLAVLGVLAINYPLIALFSQERMVLGVPMLWFYLFVFWLGFVVSIALIMRRQHGDKG
ncbi:MAG: hypothetical protein HQL97_06165 [Magnetococcales bacterium]|nr:hypothetical protein [Magnetococcales bacterium]MBF0261412.1 hypothetical protein [Magnetococcales bacterium]